MSGKHWHTVDPKTGKEIKNGGGAPSWTFPVGLVVLAIVAAIGWSQWRNVKENAELNPAAAPKPEVILTIHGSNTVGASLAPKLARGYLNQLGATEIEKIDGQSEVVSEFVGNIPGNPNPQIVRIEAHGSSTGFKSLLTHDADIAASSRPVKDKEAQALGRLGFGVMTAHTNEHVIALDGVALIVNPGNKVDKLSIDQIAGIFSGDIKNWRELGGHDAQITLYARDDKSGTFDTFRSLVLGPTRKLSEWALRFEDSLRMNELIMGDKNAIGFVGLPYIRGAKALAVSDGDTFSIQPTYSTVKSEAYPLSRRLYLYTAELPKNPHVMNFIQLAISDEGQKMARSSNLVDLSLTIERHEKMVNITSKQYQELTQAAQFVVALRYDTGLDILDSRAQADLKRFVYMMNHPDYKNREIIVVGHTDAIGEETENQRLSLERANNLARVLESSGLSVKATHGFGMEVPVAGNESPEGRRRNRRVEIYLGS